jgi:hypothetical protein
VRLDLDEQARVGRRHVDPLDDLGLADEALELGDGEPVDAPQLGLRGRRLGVGVGVIAGVGRLVVRVDDLAFDGRGVGIRLRVWRQRASS